MKIYLLTHEREADRPTNTGKLAVDLFPDNIFRIIWSRVSPDPLLTTLAKTKQIALLHPHGQPLNSKNEQLNNHLAFDHFILIDATWQEAQKIFNRSEYLQKLEKFSLTSEHPSSYRLRRNQTTGGLCTAECIIELFKTQNEIKSATQLQQRFELFNQVNHRSG